jgi:hypothetical protein
MRALKSTQQPTQQPTDWATLETTKRVPILSTKCVTNNRPYCPAVLRPNRATHWSADSAAFHSTFKASNDATDRAAIYAAIVGAERPTFSSAVGTTNEAADVPALGIALRSAEQLSVSTTN